MATATSSHPDAEQRIQRQRGAAGQFSSMADAYERVGNRDLAASMRERSRLSARDAANIEAAIAPIVIPAPPV